MPSLNMFEFFVQETLWIYDMFQHYDWIFEIFYFICSIFSFSIFLHHETELKDLDFFMANVTKLYDFSFTRYKLYKAVFTVVLPLAMFIIVWSFIERFNSSRFLQRFG